MQYFRHIIQFSQEVILILYHQAVILKIPLWPIVNQ